MTKGVVLEKEPFNEADQRVTVFTEGLGKIFATVKSGRKIVSKLSAHLEPGNFVQVRLVEKHSFHVTDALRLPRARAPLSVLKLLQTVAPEAARDYDLWGAVAAEPFSFRRLLDALGFDPRHAVCDVCGTGTPAFFSFRDTAYWCSACATGQEEYSRCPVV